MHVFFSPIYVIQIRRRRRRRRRRLPLLPISGLSSLVQVYTTRMGNCTAMNPTGVHSVPRVL